MAAAEQAIPVDFFYDYSCPFCYVGSHRLLRLAQRYPLRIRWRPLELHPKIPAEGAGIDQLDCTDEQKARVDAALAALTEDEKAVRRPGFMPNTRPALLLAQACLDHAPEHFPALHIAIYNAYFEREQNIGELPTLAAIAADSDAAKALPKDWTAPQYMFGLMRHVRMAQKLELTSLPTLVVGHRAFDGAAAIDVFEQALQQHLP